MRQDRAQIEQQWEVGRWNMRSAKQKVEVKPVSQEAAKLGVPVGMTGEEALEFFR